ncbi:MAG: hypothetical protein AAB805_00615 [Patescibacteria group bacterium]
MLTLHIFSVIFSFCVIFLADKQGLAWIRGKKETLDPKWTRTLHQLAWAGLLALLATGAFLFWPRREYLLGQPLFAIKMLFVLALLINAILIGRLMHVATERPFRTLSFNERVPLFVSGAISLFSWLGALIAALVLFG